MGFSRLTFACLTIFFLAGCSAAQNNKGAVAANTSSQSAEGKVAHELLGVQFTVPSEWKEEKEDGKYIYTIPNDSMTIIVYAPADRSMEAAMKEVDERIKNKKNTGVDMRSAVIADDMRAQRWIGTGEVGNSQVDWVMTMIGTDGKSIAILTYGQLDKAEKGYKLGQLISSLRKPKRG